jgi:hypothetical protein
LTFGLGKEPVKKKHHFFYLKSNNNSVRDDYLHIIKDIKKVKSEKGQDRSLVECFYNNESKMRAYLRCKEG